MCQNKDLEHKLHKLRNPCFLMTTDNQRLSDSLFLRNLCNLRSFISFDAPPLLIGA
ncbi:hypothetical protein HMPREF9446_03616 [Bacteroides fluxus YIT 12057]|uniref:Uncharacterized protein n=1 Tax=Bacteroides fluxus YIT 12057 TaxID=763034 RepID=F3PXW8_9BACE|nr:hypothetical protein HMPREF9446_03616 [Bacteroides fluxus YIT 12057]